MVSGVPGEVELALLDPAQAAEAGLAMLDAGGDFADGVIAYEGLWLGAEMFVSFDKKAVEMLREQGVEARVL